MRPLRWRRKRPTVVLFWNGRTHHLSPGDTLTLKVHVNLDVRDALRLTEGTFTTDVKVVEVR